MREKIYKRTIPLVILFIIGFTSIMVYFIDSPIITKVEVSITDVASIIAGFTSIIGLLALIKRHIYEARKRVPGRWFLSIWCIFVAIYVVFIGVFLGPETPQYIWFFATFYQPIRISLSAIYIFSMAFILYKKVILKDWYSIAFAFSMITLMLTNAPTFNLLIPGLKPFSNWILNVINSTEKRTLAIGLGVSMTITSFKIIFGRQAEFITGSADKGGEA